MKKNSSLRDPAERDGILDIEYWAVPLGHWIFLVGYWIFMILFPLEGCAPSQPDFAWERRSPDRLYAFRLWRPEF